MMEIRTEESVADLVSIYEPVIRACCRRYNLPDDRIEDVTHDTFLAAYKNLASYRGDNRMSTWLWSIARNQIIDQIRRESPRRCIGQIGGHPGPLMETSEPADLAQKNELYQVLRVAVETLPHAWRRVVTLHYWHHEDARQIARRLRIKPGLVCVILHRSRQRLRKSLMSTPVRPEEEFAVAS